jgi:ubiquinone/menaquinone biosynthesis C-methylase UbiE
MSLAGEYKRQRAWRDWAAIFDALPSLQGRLVLDLGCGVGDQSAELMNRGARVIGIDANEALLQEARAHAFPNVEFRREDLRALPDLDVSADGLWCSFVAAYFPDLPTTLRSWKRHLRSGGWIVLTEIDNLFGHEPLSAGAHAVFERFAREALAAKRYDFHMGHKLRGYLEESGFTVQREFTLEDRELSLTGAAQVDVVDAWRARLDRLSLRSGLAVDQFERLREEFLSCLGSANHRSNARVFCCVATSNADEAVDLQAD